VFEAGAAGQGRINSIFEVLSRNRHLPQNAIIGGWSFQNKELLPLQAADTVAYEFYRFLKNELIDNPKRPLRLSAKDVFRPCDTHFFAHWDKKTFVQFLKEWYDPKKEEQIKMNAAPTLMAIPSAGFDTLRISALAPQTSGSKSGIIER
jgi:hypothetical protein